VTLVAPYGRCARRRVPRARAQAPAHRDGFRRWDGQLDLWARL